MVPGLAAVALVAQLAGVGVEVVYVQAGLVQPDSFVRTLCQSRLIKQGGLARTLSSQIVGSAVFQVCAFNFACLREL